MKRLLTVILALALILSLTACGKSKEAQAVDDQIAAIGTVSLDSEAAIKAAEAALKALEPKAAEQVENVAVLEAARAELNILTTAAKVEETIKALGTVTLDSENAVAEARKLFNESSAEVQAKVANAADLTAAEQRIVELKEQASQQRADAVAALIDAIGTVTLDSEAAIKVAQDAYDGLDKTDAAKVANANVLKAAADTLKGLKKQAVMSQLKNFKSEVDKVRNLSFYYPPAFPYSTSAGYWYADQRSFVLPYMGMQGNDVWLRLVCNYTSGDWVFFKKITFAVDDQRFYETFKYSEVTRDNAAGDVWEYVDLNVGKSEIEMLWAIANSTETIIRFEGDDYYRDFTVTAKDKDSIRQMLTIYESLA